VSTSEYSDVEYVFEPHSRAMPDVREYVEALWDRREFMAELAKTDLRTARSSTALGNLWSVLDPLFQAAIYFFLYIVLRGGGGDMVAFLPVLIGGIFLFGLSTAALGDGGASIKRSSGLMLNSTFPRALLPVTTVYKSIRGFVPSACVFVVLFPLVGGKLGPGIFVLPFLFAIQTVMSIGIALLASTYVTLVPDGGNVVNYIGRILFFATPVIYPVSLLPPNAKVLIAWQPLFPLFASYQAVLSGGTPSAGLVIQCLLWAIGLLVLGGWYFLRHEREFTIHL
jgi:ABC-type polysaccharide/polyol phosphate export permease